MFKTPAHWDRLEAYPTRMYFTQSIDAGEVASIQLS
jgi:hypothetical protein